jgi:hypothetical protein
LKAVKMSVVASIEFFWSIMANPATLQPLPFGWVLPSKQKPFFCGVTLALLIDVRGSENVAKENGGVPARVGRGDQRGTTKRSLNHHDLRLWLRKFAVSGGESYIAPPVWTGLHRGETQTQVNVGVGEECLRELFSGRCTKRCALQWRSKNYLRARA